ncbi:MAG: hypothetical protein P1R58_03095 [bacterium]|nr:hypothetical protein [bacterium]
MRFKLSAFIPFATAALLFLISLDATPAGAACSYSSDWTSTIGLSGSETARSIRQTADGGYAFLGSTSSMGGSNDFYLVRLDECGVLVWSKNFGGGSSEFGTSMDIGSSGDFIIAGTADPNLTNDYVIRTSSSGEYLFGNNFGGSIVDMVMDVLDLSGGGCVLVGGAGLLAMPSDVHFIKANTVLGSFWSKTIGGPGSDIANSICLPRNGGFVMAGRTDSYGAGAGDFYLLKLSAVGDSLWARTYGTAGDEAAFSVIPTADSGFVLVGSGTPSGGGTSDAFILKTDSVGNELWRKSVGGLSDEVARTVQENAQGELLIAGWTNSFGAGGFDFYIIKLNANGDLLWTDTRGGAGDDKAFELQTTSDGGYILAGETSSFGAGTKNAYLVKSADCCLGTRGNIDNDPGDNADISDLTYLIDFLFSGGPAPACFDEADVNGSGGLDISDNTYLISYIFGGGPAPVSCH